MRDIFNLSKTIPVLVILFFCRTLYAGDAAELNFIGFSEDGKYLAFEQFGIEDGSGFPYSNIFTVNVVNNSFVYSPIKWQPDYDTDEIDLLSLEYVYQKVLTIARPKLQELGIVRGNKGLHLIHHPSSDLDANPTHVRFTSYPDPLPGLGGWDNYELTLKEIPTISKGDIDPETGDTLGYYLDFGPAKMLKLTLKNLSTNDIIVLQKDTKLPKSRGYVLSYRIQDVFIYTGNGGTYIAVFLSFLTPGFEGPDMRFLAITGEMN